MPNAAHHHSTAERFGQAENRQNMVKVDFAYWLPYNEKSCQHEVKTMRSFMAILTALVLMAAMAAVSFAEGQPAEEAAYQAILRIDCGIREEAGGTKRIQQLHKNDKVIVYEYGDTWSRVEFKGKVGWIKTEWMWHFVSCDPAKYPTPGTVYMAGVLTLTSPQLIEGGEFRSLAAETGALICVNPAQNGYAMPVWRGEGTLAEESGTFTAFVPWREAQPGDLIGGFTTFLNEERYGKKGEARLFNIAEGCRRIEGVRIAAGEEFSFNAYCGPYTKKNGYLEARNIGNNGVGYGGGVCQVSTTLYNAVLALPLRVTEWEIHRWIGVEYIPQLFDASVGAYSDFSFVNMTGYDITLETHLSNGVVTVLIRRAAE